MRNLLRELVWYELVILIVGAPFILFLVGLAWPFVLLIAVSEHDPYMHPGIQLTGFIAATGGTFVWWMILAWAAMDAGVI